MKYFVTTDIHGHFSIWMDALLKAGFDENNPTHKLIICGDIIDRGPESAKVIDYLYDFPQDRLVMIRGNHEDLFEDLINRGTYYSCDLSNGTLNTMLDVLNIDLFRFGTEKYYAKEIYEKSKMKKVFDRMLDYFELKNYIFVHGWIPCDENSYDPEWRNVSKREWDNARWLNGMECYKKGIYEKGKTIICGHWHTAYANCRANHKFNKEEKYDEYSFSKDRSPEEIKELFKPFIRKGIVALDACTAYTGLINVYIIND